MNNGKEYRLRMRVGIAICLCLSMVVQAQISQNPGTPWPAMDDLHRALPAVSEVGPPRPDRFVGLFYFLWLGQHGSQEIGPFDVTKIMTEHPEALQHPTSPPWGPAGDYHFWSEPLYGYYRSDDPWVIRRHGHLLADAGIDVLIFDTTNAVTYDSVVETVCRVFSQIREEGGRTPQLAFMVNTKAGDTAQRLYEQWYKPGVYPELWFRWQGRPLMICDPAQASDEVKTFFTLRGAHWPFTQVNTPYAWHWESIYPQVYGYTDDPHVPEQVNVSVAQNLRQKDGAVTPMSHGDARGRSFHNQSLDTRLGAALWGYNAQEQWNRALALAPPFVMVTGWNEWVAGRFSSAADPVMFVDQFDEEGSRDIEPARGLHQDNYYWQLIANVRRYKGMLPLPRASGPKTITLDQGFEQWEEVLPEFRDHHGEVQQRDHRGSGQTHYRNVSGRNELLSFKVTYDNAFVYFYAHTEKPLTSWQASGWMNLLIDSDQNAQTGWQGFDFMVNQTVLGPNTTLLERNTGGWHWEKQTEISYRVEGCALHLAIPREALGLAPGTAVKLDFKWTDNWQHRPEVMDWYLSGDTAPEGRFKFRYQAE